MTPGAIQMAPFFVCLLWSIVFCGGWVSASRAAELPLPPVQETLADHGAGPMRAIETPLTRGVSLDVPLDRVARAEAIDTDEQQSRALGAVPAVVPVGSTPDLLAGALEPVNPLGSGGSRLEVQSLNPASAQKSAPIHSQR